MITATLIAVRLPHGAIPRGAKDYRKIQIRAPMDIVQPPTRVMGCLKSVSSESQVSARHLLGQRHANDGKTET